MLKRYFEVIDEKCYNYEKVMNRQQLKQEWVDRLREMARRSQYIPKVIDDRLLLVFVNNCRENTEMASKWLHKYYKLKSNTPEFHSERDPYSKSFKHAFENLYFAALPNTPDNHFVFYHALSNFEPRNYNFDEGVKCLLMMAEAKLFSEGPRAGALYIMDLKGVRFNHIFCPSIQSVKKGIEMLQTANPILIKAVHVINSFWFMDLVFSMIKPFLKKEFFDRIHLHPIGSDLSNLFNTDVPKQLVPKELGGECGTIKEHHETTRKLIEELREYFILEADQASLKFDKYVNSQDYKYRHLYLT
ncbi:hypothetical protein PVAND_009121 [Polypedilum vanderplanki]|uniref:CRAL-TRIO domain-containing protein n=1 Tax=Polypedilum vanderplanki TaxID=319348 RepID=A0A9J6CBN5_POLVA|nr:hypothetical protein PVAND_009121 [Polypedilum vanderplanki]